MKGVCLYTICVRYVPPAEDTLVGTGEARGGLHAAVGLNAIEGVLVAAASPPQHGLINRKQTPVTSFLHLVKESFKVSSALSTSLLP